jgi:hypothetical protein
MSTQSFRRFISRISVGIVLTLTAPSNSQAAIGTYIDSKELKSAATLLSQITLIPVAVTFGTLAAALTDNIPSVVQELIPSDTWILASDGMQWVFVNSPALVIAGTVGLISLDAKEVHFSLKYLDPETIKNLDVQLTDQEITSYNEQFETLNAILDEIRVLYAKHTDQNTINRKLLKKAYRTQLNPHTISAVEKLLPMLLRPSHS